MLTARDVPGPAAPASWWVDTPSAQRHLAHAALALSTGRAVLLEGVRGSGKSALIAALAAAVRVSPNELTRVHLTAQSDAKLLLGTYVVTEIPGEFRWVPGVLVRAVQDGHWLVLENVDAAPVEVQTLLLPLLERRELFVPGRGELLRAHPNFALFGTRVIGTSASAQRRLLHDSLWCRVHVAALTSSELREILSARWPALGVLTEPLLQAAACVGGAAGVDARALFKAAARLATVVRDHALALTAPGTHLSAAVREAAWLECLDVWLAALPDATARTARALELARVWQLSEERAQYFLQTHKPTSAHTPSGELHVGRARLPVLEAAAAGRASGAFAATRVHAVVLERVARAVQCAECVLLVGETGVGKTTAVQELAAQLGQRLVVLNLSQQSDSADFLGGFKPVDLAHFVRPLVATFERLFARTFSAHKNAALLLRLQQSVARADWRTVLAVCSKTLARVHALDDDADTPREESDAQTAKRVRRERVEPTVRAQWEAFGAQVRRLERILVASGAQAMAFAFVEGALVQAVREGAWVLLDEVNLASEATLESLAALLEGGSLWLTERGDLEPVPRHPNFKVRLVSLSLSRLCS